MPFNELNIKKIIENEKAKNPEFARVWKESRIESKVFAKFIKLEGNKIK